MSRTIPFPWYGSKYNQLPWLLDLLPQTERYVEPFGGAGTVLINREPSDVETFNDLNEDVVNFFDVLRSQKEELLRRLRYTPYSRQMFQRACTEVSEDDVQRALFFLIRVAQSHSAREGSSWASSVGTSRRGRSQRVSAWESREEQIAEAADRLRRVQIENRDALDVIERHDHKDALFYCDPPYPPQSRESGDAYIYEMGERDHRDLAELLRNCEGMVAVSGYQCDLLDDLYDGWRVYSEGEKGLAGKGTTTREEVLYTNYDINSL
jgi:DNA adenine methylase